VGEVVAELQLAALTAEAEQRVDVLGLVVDRLGDDGGAGCRRSSR
jgi:hypothetical protein